MSCSLKPNSKASLAARLTTSRGVLGTQASLPQAAADPQEFSFSSTLTRRRRLNGSRQEPQSMESSLVKVRERFLPAMEHLITR